MPAWIPRPGLERRILLLLSVMASIGCVSARAPFAQVESVVRENRLAAGAELQGVRVTRGAASLTTATGLALQKGDRIVTDGSSEAVILFGDAYEVLLSPNTDISISPDIFLNFGKVIVKKLKEIKKKFTVETKYVNAGVEHTEFAVWVDRGDLVSVVVLEGTVTLESTTRSWPPQTVGAREGATIRAGQLPSPRERVPQDELDRTFGWGSRVEAIAFAAVIPDLTGLSLDQARTQLSRAGLRVGRIQRVAGQPLGTVLRQSRRAGERARLGTPVDLDVAGESTVPDVRGMSRLEAGIVLAAAGFQTGETVEEEVAGAKPGKVARQSPAPGTRVPPGTPVSLVISSVPPVKPDGHRPEAVRPEPVRPEAALPKVCTVPDVLSGGSRNARKILEGAGLKLGRVLQRIEGPPYQDPKAGARVACGSSVDVSW
ncbi:MAG: PASTA domain-containing protein [Acidobacteria bacterium]|nr:PASTA domain-containing protein [Acidobacteriota bacterium]